MQKNHRRYYRIAGITIQVESDLPISDKTFHPKFKLFEVKGPQDDMVLIRHHFSLPNLRGKSLGVELYYRPPWAIYKKDDAWIYFCIQPRRKQFNRVAIFNNNYTCAEIYNDTENTFLRGNHHSLTLLITDQIFLAHILADRQGCYIHSCGVNFADKGILFVGNSGAGKSTVAQMLKDKAEILCDDRMIIKRRPEGFKIYGTWSHGDVPEVSANSVPLKAIMFLEKAEENCLMPLDSKKEITKRLLSSLIKPLLTVEWWKKTLSLIDKISSEAPCYLLRFDRTKRIEDILKRL